MVNISRKNSFPRVQP